ncbi:probable prolyl 4-hydroxylase 6 [Typha angustifolia]|uniref:probable prolyl 4-hydroxylase 6 n=1 Tax=Typha angustifolia TaxID=59011 RepID=UPI003C2D06FF
MGYRRLLAFFSLLLLVSLILLLPEKEITAVAFDPTRVTQVSWKPRAFLYKGFLSHDECDHLIKLAKNRLEKSMVADNLSGKSMMSNVRTSSGMFLAKRQDAIVSRIEERIAAWTFLPEENAEPIQVLHYGIGQKYDAHFDYFQDKKNQARGGHRAATVLMYLSDVKMGGETVFPNAEGGQSQLKDETWSECARQGYAVKPSKGDAVLFFSLNVDGTTDPHSLHGSCPVIEGEKWSAPKWIHVKSYDNLQTDSLPGECSDKNVLCEQWAAAGECQKNPIYMVGNNNTLGNCQKSCGLCDS